MRAPPSVMLGTRSTTSGLYHFGRDFRAVYPNAVTLPQYFMQHGYRAESVGKVFHVGHGNYDDAVSWSVPSFKDRVVEYLLPESTDGGKLTREEACFGNLKTSVQHFELPRGAAWENVDVPDNAYADCRVATEGIRRLHEAKRSRQPFFLAVGFARPHLPFTVPKKYWDLYDPAKLPLAKNPNPPAGAPPYALKKLGELNQYEPVPERPPLTEELQRTLIHGYYAGVSYVDAQIGRVLAELERLGLARLWIALKWHGRLAHVLAALHALVLLVGASAMCKNFPLSLPLIRPPRVEFPGRGDVTPACLLAPCFSVHCTLRPRFSASRRSHSHRPPRPP